MAIIRGGQLSLHSIRMFGQVAGAILKWSVISFFIGVILLMLPHTSLETIELLIKAGISHFFYGLGFDNITHVMPVGSYRIKMTALEVVRNFRIEHTIMEYRDLLIDKMWWSLGISSSFAIIAVVFFAMRGRVSKKKRGVRGGSLIETKLLQKQIKKHNRKEGWKDYLSIATIPYPKYAETQHTLVTGTTGSGKTVVISDLVEQIQESGGKAIIYDKMGNFVEKFYNPDRDIILNPFDERSPYWSVFGEVEMAANFDSIASAFIPVERGNDSEFWVKAARTIFSSVCSKVFNQGETLTNYQLVKILMKQALSEVSKIVKNTPAAAILSPDSPKTALSVMSVISTYLKPLQYLKDEGDSFSIRDWVLDENKKGLIFLTSKGNLHGSLEPLISAWLEIAITSILSLDRSTKRRIWLIIDELPSLYKLPSLETGLAEVRQFGGCFVLGSQSKTQLSSRYGRDVSETINSLCGTKVHLRTPDEETSRWCSSNLGKEEVEETHEGVSFGAHEMRDGVNLNTQKREKVLVMPSQLSSLENLEGYIKPVGGFAITKFEMEYKDRGTIAKHFTKSPHIEDIAKKMAAVEEETIVQADKIVNDNTSATEAVPNIQNDAGDSTSADILTQELNDELERLKEQRKKEDAQIEALKANDDEPQDDVIDDEEVVEITEDESNDNNSKSNQGGVWGT